MSIANEVNVAVICVQSSCRLAADIEIDHVPGEVAARRGPRVRLQLSNRVEHRYGPGSATPNLTGLGLSRDPCWVPPATLHWRPDVRLRGSNWAGMAKPK